ncbi:MAG: hypothetical protein AAFV53_04530 [Myxococcota bacterium]
MTIHHPLIPGALLFFCACAPPEEAAQGGAPNGLITGVILNVAPLGGGQTLRFGWSDPGDGGDPILDDIVLQDASDEDPHAPASYQLSVEVWDEQAEPAADVTPDVLNLAEQHQLFITGSAIDGPATAARADAILAHEYADSDRNGLPLGLDHRVTTQALGSGEFTVTVRYLPLKRGEPQKVAGLAEAVAVGGFNAIPGRNDAQVTFNVRVE